MTSRRHAVRTDKSTEGFGNPFCVLGLSADATGIDIQRTAQQALMRRRLDEASGDAEHEIRVIEDARDLLKDPVVRFQAGLQWVTLSGQELEAWSGLPELGSLAFDRKILVEDAYERIATANSVTVRNHNLAVLLCADAHRLASLGDIQAAAKLWGRGFERWALCLASDEFLKRQRERARSLEDGRLNMAFVAEELAGIPRRLLAEPAALASRALESRRVVVAAALVDLIRSAPFDSEFIDAVLETVYRPLARRVESQINQLDARRSDMLTRSDTSTGGKASERLDLRELLDAFKDQAAPDLEQMLELGDLPGLAEEHARDHASRFLEQLGLDAWNVADDAELAQEAVQLASRYADAKSLKDKLSTSLSLFSDHVVLQSELEEIMALAKGSSAPRAIERLKSLKTKVTVGDSKKLLDTLIERVSNHHSVTLFNDAMEIVQRKGDPSAVRKKLEEARRYATDSEARAALDKYLQQVRSIESRVSAQQGTGCLIPIIIGAGLMGFVITRGVLL